MRGRLGWEPSTVALRLAAAAAFLLFLAIVWVRYVPDRLDGDEGTYVAMAESLVRDGDLRFGEADAAWAHARATSGIAVILERTPRGVAYSKPILYPLVAAPFVAAFGERGLLLAQLTLLAAALALAWAALRRRPGGERAAALLAAFVLASTVAPYLGWKMPEALEVALATAGLALALGAALGPPPAASGALDRLLGRPAAPWIGAALLGLLAASREPNAAIAVVPVLAAALAGRFRRAAGLAATSAASYLAMVALALLFTGAPNPYKAPRSLFDGRSGYPAGAEAAAVLGRFEAPSTLSTSTLRAIPSLRPATTLYASLYFFVGRHSGVLFYFPFALAILVALRRGTDPIGWAALAGFGALALFYLVWWPDNYFGGETCVGNRYQLPALACLLFVPPRLPSRRALALSWAVTLVVGASALLSVVRTAELDPLSQDHAYAGLFRLLPYESTARGFDGRRDRYWAEDFVRFVDPYARVGPTSFELDSGEPGAGLEIATSWPGNPLHWLVVCDARGARLVVSDWLTRRRDALATSGTGSGGPLVTRLAPAWRFHRFWWPSPSRYHVRLVRLRLETAPGRPARARVRYLGRGQVPTAGFGDQLVSWDPPAEAVAGTASRLRVELVNRGRWTWRSDASLPVLLGAKLVPLDVPGAPVELRGELPHPVPPGGRVATWMDVSWPERPGRYRVTLDLVLEDVAWFADRVGAPAGEATVTVVPAVVAAAPAAPPRR